MSLHDQTHTLCDTCGMPATTDERPCCCDCEHADVDDFECLTCGKELLEDMAAAAFDRAKDARWE
jgi:predicted amidophosphoribosyltransferase